MVDIPDTRTKDPISAVGLGAGAIQFADIGVKTLIGLFKLLERLKHTPKRMSELLHDMDSTILRIHGLQKAIHEPNSILKNLSSAQFQRVEGNLNDAHQTVLDLQNALEPLFRRSDSSGYDWAKDTWRSVVSVSMETRIAEQIARLKWLNGEMMSEIQLVGLEMQARLE